MILTPTKLISHHTSDVMLFNSYDIDSYQADFAPHLGCKAIVTCWASRRSLWITYRLDINMKWSQIRPRESGLAKGRKEMGSKLSVWNVGLCEMEWDSGCSYKKVLTVRTATSVHHSFLGWRKPRRSARWNGTQGDPIKKFYELSGLQLQFVTAF